MKLFAWLWLFFIQQKCIAIDIDDINLSNCTNGSSCDDTTIDINPFDGNVYNLTSKPTDGEATSLSTKNVHTTTEMAITTVSTIGTTEMNDVQRKLRSISKNHTNVCSCDLKILSCDTNCCCDLDCNDFQLSAFSHCDDHRSKKYDSRYCYTKNFIQRNRTQFILERLASNLFCIAYDNLPPIYGTDDIPTLRNRRAFERAKDSTNTKKHTWNFNNLVTPLDFNFSSHYHADENIWKFQHNSVQLMKLPQSGLTGQCTFAKSLKYLKTSNWKCMQTNLSNNNAYLFDKMYNNFTIVSSPHLFNSSYITSDNHSCPNNVCLSVRSFYCLESWNNCNETNSYKQLCSSGECQNIVKRIRYTFFHNGTNGIQNIETRFILANVSRNYYQHFEIVYEWTSEKREEKFFRSGNPGYTIGNPIIIGSLVSNVTSEMTELYMNVNSSNYYLTLPLGGKNGNCMKKERYVMKFGENVKLGCKVEMRTKDFSSSSSSLMCMNLQNETLKFMLEDSLRGLKEIDKYQIYISKTGDLAINDMNKWTPMLLDKIPRNVITGQIFNNEIRCSGLVTSIHVEILYTIIPNHGETDSYQISGVALTFSEPRDFSWTKCVDKNCVDFINTELISYVTFTDISTPSMYYYAGGPNLDISLPYDFFYPFMSSTRNNQPLNVLLVVSLIHSFSHSVSGFTMNLPSPLR